MAVMERNVVTAEKDEMGLESVYGCCDGLKQAWISKWPGVQIGRECHP